MKNKQARDDAVISFKSLNVAHSESLIRSMVTSIDGFQDMEIRVSIKFSFDTFSFGNKGTKNTWSKTFKAHPEKPRCI